MIFFDREVRSAVHAGVAIARPNRPANGGLGVRTRFPHRRFGRIPLLESKLRQSSDQGTEAQVRILVGEQTFELFEILERVIGDFDGEDISIIGNRTDGLARLRLFARVSLRDLLSLASGPTCHLGQDLQFHFGRQWLAEFFLAIEQRLSHTHVG